MNEIQILRELQKADLEEMRAEKELKDLPEAAQILECRAKRKELKAKQDQAIKLSDDAEQKMKKLDEEENQVLKKIADLQKTIDTTSDYRVIRSATRDMEGQIKRQGGIDQEQSALVERQIKIDHLANQIADMLHELDHKEAHLTKDFKEKGGALKKIIDESSARHDELIAQLDRELAERYEKIAAEKGGMAVAELKNGHCSACGTAFLEGQLGKLKDGPALTECPSCHRLFIARDE